MSITHTLELFTAILGIVIGVPMEVIRHRHVRQILPPDARARHSIMSGAETGVITQMDHAMERVIVKSE